MQSMFVILSTPVRNTLSAGTCRATMIDDLTASRDSSRASRPCRKLAAVPARRWAVPSTASSACAGELKFVSVSASHVLLLLRTPNIQADGGCGWTHRERYAATGIGGRHVIACHTPLRVSTPNLSTDPPPFPPGSLPLVDAHTRGMRRCRGVQPTQNQQRVIYKDWRTTTTKNATG